MLATRFCPVCGAANETTQTQCFACGQLLATNHEDTGMQSEALLHERYQLGSHLGSGGFSVVQRARDVYMGEREVAIKQINLQGLSAEEKIEATNTFNREVNLLSTLHHPQIPQLYEHFNDRDHWYLVLEYLEGTTLEVYLEKLAAQGKSIHVDEALAMALQLCTVLEYLHTRQPVIIFRDLKPGNIIRTPNGKLCLIDFGIARHYRPGQARDTQRLGSPGYAAPEQYGRAQTTPQADIYSLGALLHALLSGQDPAEQSQGLAPLRLDFTTGGTDLAEFVQRMLAPDPGTRPATIGDVARTLTVIQQQRAIQNNAAHIWQPPIPQAPTSATSQQQIQLQVPARPGTISPLPPKRHTGRRPILIGLGTLAVVAAGSGIWWYNATPHYPYTYRGHTGAVESIAWSPDSRRIASASADGTLQIWDAANGRNALSYPERSTVDIVAWSPDGQILASSTIDGNDVMLRRINDTDNFQAIEGNPGAIAWSPNSQYLAFATKNNSNVDVWGIGNSHRILTYRGHSAQVNAVAWSQKNNLIASASGDTTAQIWNIKGDHILTYHGHANILKAIAWSPDGQHVASADDNGVQVWDARTGGQIATYDYGSDAIAWSPHDSNLIASAYAQTVQVWQPLTGKAVSTYIKHTDLVSSIAWSPDGKFIASASLDTTVQVWNAPDNHAQTLGKG